MSHLSREELAVERAAYLKRTKAKIDAAIAEIRSRRENEYAEEMAAGRFPFNARARVHYRRRKCEDCGASFYQRARAGRPFRRCQECRA